MIKNKFKSIIFLILIIFLFIILKAKAVEFDMRTIMIMEKDEFPLYWLLLSIKGYEMYNGAATELYKVDMNDPNLYLRDYYLFDKRIDELLIEGDVAYKYLGIKRTDSPEVIGEKLKRIGLIFLTSFKNYGFAENIITKVNFGMTEKSAEKGVKHLWNENGIYSTFYTLKYIRIKYDKEVKEKITEEEINQIYQEFISNNEIKQKLEYTTCYKRRMIMVATEELAQKIYNRLKSGESYEEIEKSLTDEEKENIEVHYYDTSIDDLNDLQKIDFHQEEDNYPTTYKYDISQKFKYREFSLNEEVKERIIEYIKTKKAIKYVQTWLKKRRKEIIDKKEIEVKYDLIASLKPENPKFTSLSIAPTSLNMNVSETQQFNATCNFDNNLEMNCNKFVRWYSSNPSIGKIDDEGLFTALKTGTTEVIVLFLSKVSQKAKITVTK